MNWKEQNEVMSASSKDIDTATGDASFDFVAYRDSIIKRCLKTWNITVNEKPVPVTSENIDLLPSSIVSALYQKFDSIVSYSDEELGN